MSVVRLEPRGQASPAMVYLTPLLAVGLTLASGFVLFWLMGFDPLDALYAFFVQPVTSLRGVGELVVKATPLVLIAVGLAIGFRANVWNIGAEGQLTLGAITGGGLALAFYGEGGWWLLPLMILAGTAGGMLWAAIPAFLRTRFNASEILTSLMLTYVAVLLLQYLTHGLYRDPEGYSFPESRLFEDDALLPVIIAGTRIHLGALFALLAVAAGWVLIARTFIGFQIRVIGLTPAAAGYAGFKEKRIVWLTLLISGGLAGLAGLGEVAGPIGQINPTISPGYGFTAIIVAFLGRLHPFGILLAGLLMALSFIGGEAAQIALALPKAITGVFQGMLLFFLLACDVLIRYRVRIGRRRAAA
ncbi:ABC transporter permease [Azospirillum sp. ST 5-10]|uniref:ABC transporter permease n=1 Tax=unclassified Azospirillum TaxID=2630922 RepID=UPI003F4A0B56